MERKRNFFSRYYFFNAIIIYIFLSIDVYSTFFLKEIQNMDYKNNELMNMRKEIAENIHSFKNNKKMNICYRFYTTQKGDEFYKIVSRSMLDSGTIASINSILYFDELTPRNKWILPNMRGVAKKGNLESLAKQFSLAKEKIYSIPGKPEWFFIPRLNNSIINKISVEKWSLPVIGKITSGFGYRMNPFTHKRQFHTGIDIAAPHGKPVKATKNGKVILAKELRGYGNTVIIEHKGGYQSLYAHLSKIRVKPGDTVRVNTIIGNVGNTGKSTGPHLHFEIRKDNTPIRPNSFFNRKI